MPAIHRLVYVSASRVAMSDVDLERLLATARENNSEAGVTGVLLYHDGSFFQVLEGDKDQVTRIFNAIERDPRHSRVIVLQTRAAPERAFPVWSMGYVRTSDLRPDLRETMIDLRDFVGTGERANLTASASVSVHIDAFLGSFREFADV